MFRLDDQNWKVISALLTPSWLSGLIIIVAALVVSVGVIATFELQGSALQQQLTAWQSTKPMKPLTTPGQTVPENDKPTLGGTWPLLVFWSLAGLVVYGIVMAIVHDLARAEELRESLDYVNARPRSTLEATAEHLLLRFVAFVLLGVTLLIFVRQVLPYSITTAHASAGDIISLDGGLYALLSFAIVAVTLHVQTVLLRLAFGRARIFHG